MAIGYAQDAYGMLEYAEQAGESALHTQVSLVIPGIKNLGIQVRLTAYNINLMRILWEIKSDGSTALNYSASTNASTDKNVVNLKSDIIEKYWQSTGCASEWIQWDTGSGRVISLDTFGLIGHNFSSSAVVKLYGYGESTDAAPGAWTEDMLYATLVMSEDPDEENLIWVAPTIPAHSYRHWRLTVVDTSNPDGFLRAGRLVAGSALVFNGENCLDEVELVHTNYKDEQVLTAFARISNNRALKKSLVFTFRNLDRVGNSNYRLLRRYMQYCRDTLKALVILDPATEGSKYQFTAFAKLKQMPREQHKYIEATTSYTALELEFDEGR